MAKIKQPKIDHFENDYDLINDEINAAWLETDTVPARPRAALLRSSALPYCPLREFVEVLEHGVAETEEASLDSALYTSLGNLWHQVLQNYMPRRFRKLDVIARWDARACVVPECPMKEKDAVHGLNRKGCAKCGQHPEHVELEFYGKYTSHVDKLYRIRGTKRVYVIDVKTSNLRDVWAYKSGGKQHPNGYLFQIDSYAVHLKPMLARLGLELCGSFILYVPRDQPRQRLLMPVRKSYPDTLITKLRDRLFRVAEGWRIVGKAIKEDDWTVKTAKGCESRRLCGSRAFYEQRVHDKYEPCPMSAVCFDQPARRKHLRKLLRLHGTKA